MNKSLLFYLPFCLLVLITLQGCKESMKSDPPEKLANQITLAPNLLSGLSEGEMRDFMWINKPENFSFEEGTLLVEAPAKSDFFINPVDGQKSSTAPVLYLPVSGDFVSVARVSPDLSGVWNAAALMVFIDDTNWIKFAFENSDATGPSIVSVTTRESSDDANGAVLSDQEEIWLKLIRKGNNYAMHWSTDGRDYKMARLSAMPEADTIKLGLEAQCPAGEGALHTFNYFSLERISINDLRTGQ